MNRRPPKDGVIREKTVNTLLVDGNALFKASINGAKNLFNREGRHIGGVYQFLTTLRMVLNNDIYHKVYVFWDGQFSGKLRYEIYEPYKSSRGKDFINGTHPTDPSEVYQKKQVWNYLNDMYIRQIRDEIVEGDDYIAYYCNTKKPNEKITIVTNDRDMAQLISNDIRIYFTDLKNYVGLSNFSEYFCYNQKNSALMKTITGDASDDIVGISGVGMKTVVKLFPCVAEREVKLTEILELARLESENRASKKLKPLKALENILNSTTTGVQGKRIYEINDKLVNLKKPMMTDTSIKNLRKLTEGTLNGSGRDLKNVMVMMERDGMKEAIGEHRYPEYLLPFKKLIDREK